MSMREKMEGGFQRLLGYNTNHGSRIDIRLRTQDLSGFEPYPALIDTLLHELAHNEVGPHDDQFWHLFAQLKADYLRMHRAAAAAGTLHGGRSPVSLAGVAPQLGDIRGAVLATVERDTRAPCSPLQVGLLDGYLALTDGADGRAAGGRVLDECAGAAAATAAPPPPQSAEERRALLAARAAARAEKPAGDTGRRSR